MSSPLNDTDLDILKNITDLTTIPEGAINIRLNGNAVIRNSTPNVSVTTDPKNNGLIVEVRANSKNEIVHVPVILTAPGLQEVTYNTFIVGENAEVEIIAGCGIHNTCQQTSRHDGVHEIIVKKGARLRYVEKHYGTGTPESKKVLNPTATIRIEKDGYAEMEMIQIAGVDDTKRYTKAILEPRANLKITERLLTNGKQFALSEIEVYLSGEDSNAQIISRGVGQDDSKQVFKAALVGQANSMGHLECDAIIMDNALIQSIPELRAENSEAVLTHEAAIGKIAGEQLIKLMSLGLSEEDAIDTILKSFLN